MRILEVLVEPKSAYSEEDRESIGKFLTKTEPLDVVTMVKEKQMIADIFFMDDKYRDFFEHSLINYNLSGFNSEEDIAQSLSFDDSNKLVSTRLDSYVDDLENSGNKYLYYYIRQDILFEEKEYSIYAKYRIDCDGNRSLIDIESIPKEAFHAYCGYYIEEIMESYEE